MLGAEVALVAGARPHDARLGVSSGGDRVGDALVGALLRKGPRPRVESFARAVVSRSTPGARKAHALPRGRR